MKRAKLIVIEGPDKSGKATQSKLLAKTLNDDGFSAVRVEVPIKKSLTGSLIYSMLKSGTVARHPLAFQFLQFVNKFTFQLFSLRKLMRSNDYVILDRWSLSSLVYGVVSGCPEWYVFALYYPLVKPDMTFVMHGRTFDRNAKTLEEKGTDDAYESDNKFMSRIKRKYIAMTMKLSMKAHGKFMLVSNLSDVDDINRKIVASTLSVK